ncbi:type II toxin-antitoxin system RnlB family antitoxin [Macrococcoides caseolyticum]|uniref:type II toxin-antitoxin system RnlB family antitoxin n=1 Tax=Macrococcoides caseolyticum TaxID=69966 RepID=UPI000C3384D4|nr:type II toxin-antitoxin system RnlB family antitoxin [Macrococcus caseolyticus]PKE16741.1 hypothetical protein CW718_08165 [Macrococcus caseolyticus]
MFIKVNENEVILLMDKHRNPSSQIKEYGLEKKLNGYYIFDTILVKGLRSNRFLKIYFSDGKVDNERKRYITFNEEQLHDINKQVFESVHDLTYFLLPREIQKISS